MSVLFVRRILRALVALAALGSPALAAPSTDDLSPSVPFSPDVIFADGFESRGLSHWSTASTGGGDLAVNTSAALGGTRLGLRGTVNDLAGLYVEDDSPADEDHYRARFLFDPNIFDPGESSAHFRVRLFIAFEENPVRRLLAVILKRQGGQYSVMGRARLDDNSQANTAFFPVTPGPHSVEVNWRRASVAGNDGSLRLSIDDVQVAVLGGLTNRLSSVDFVRLGVLNVKPGASGVLYWDEFESHRAMPIGPPTCASGTRSCYDAAAATAGVGACHPGAQYCVDGQWGPCTGESTPREEVCNGLDDDCNGAVDDGMEPIHCGIGACAQSVPSCVAGLPQSCLPGTPQTEVCDGVDNDCDGAVDEECASPACVFVSPTGNDVIGNGTLLSPFLTVGAGIARAVLNGTPRVCVAAGANCSANATYPEVVTMSDGVSVYGGYESTAGTRCGSGGITRIANQDGRGVYFGPSVTSPTILDGFTVLRASFPTTSGITVEGSVGASISNLTITNAAVAATSYGVSIVDSAGTPATPTLFRNLINGGNGTALSVAVRSSNSAPAIIGNCGTFDPVSGRCTSLSCGVSPACLVARAASGTGSSFGVQLLSSPGARIDANAITSGGTSSASSAGIFVSGPASGTLIRANTVFPFGSDDIAGVWLEDCADDAPLVYDNTRISATGLSGSATADGVRALGACHPRIQSNSSIQGPGEGAAGSGNGVRCGQNASGLASDCTVSGNALIQGSSTGFPPAATGVRCEDGACGRIENNTITGRGGLFSCGLFLGRTGALVRDNTIRAGCGLTEADGVLSAGSFARLENNWIEGFNLGACATTTGTSNGVKILLADSRSQLDLHSNDVFGGGSTLAACTSRGIGLQGGGASSARGLVRNNVISGGVCSVNMGIGETSADADPAVLENNDIWTSSGASVLYRDEQFNDLTTIAAVNALVDITAAANVSADPMLADTVGHLMSGSPARNAGTCTEAPAFDFERDPRPQELVCDIGRDELVP